MIQCDIKNNIDKFIKLRNSNTHRYASFDICFYYFQTNRENIAKANNIEISCLQLWSYLSSWGMLRGSSKLLQKSPAALKPLVEHIAQSLVWDIDVDDYTDENIEKLLEEYHEIEEILNAMDVKPTLTLVTKIMLGVYGNIPAYDTYFTETFRNESAESSFRRVNKKSLEVIREFYEHNKSCFNQQIKVIDFNNNPTELIYTKAKLIDMYGFEKGITK